MKKNLFVLLVFSCLSNLKAQDNWDSVIIGGFGAGNNFTQIKKFGNKLYLAGNNTSSLNLFVSPSGDMGSYTAVPGIAGAVQGGIENHFSAAVSNANYLFLGSGVASYTPGLQTPQVYRFDGTNFVMHGAIPYTNLPSNDSMVVNASPEIGAMALFSPTGSNDTIYAFLNPDLSHNISVWKASATSASPTWINATNFPAITGVTHIYDAITWHKRLYIAVNCADSSDGANLYPSSLILSTANGVDWDTVGKSSQFIRAAGYTPVYFYTPLFKAFGIHNDTLVVGMDGSDGASLWGTVDSLSAVPHWVSLYNNNDQQFYGIVDLQSDGKQIWIQCDDQSGYVNVYRWSQALAWAGFLPNSSSGCDMMSYNQAWSFHLELFNNAMYSSGYLAVVSGTDSSGVTWRLKYPVASFTTNPVNACESVNDTLKNTSLNSIATIWKMDTVVYSHATDTTFFFPGPGTHTITLISINGTGGLNSLLDSVKQVITIHPTPVIDSVAANLTTICQGQSDTVKAYVHGNGPFTYAWTQALNIIGPNSVIPFIFTTAQVMPIGFFAIDMYGCQSSYPGTLSINVNAADTLSGTIVDSLLNPVTSGIVYLFQQKSNHVGVADSAGTAPIAANGSYNFPGLYYGDYYLKAVADTNLAAYKTSVGTYYSNKANAYQWDSALVIQQYTCSGGNNSGKDIQIIQIPATVTGPGQISGVVTEGPGYGQRYGNGGFAPMGAPLKGVDVKLGRNPSGGAAARTTTNNNGVYTFNNIPAGSYRIYIDIPNYGMDSVRTVTINTITPTSIHNDYYVDSNMVRVVPTNTVSAFICQGDSIYLENAYQHNAGVYYDTLHATGGYDSLVVTSLSIHALPTLSVSTNADTICVGNSAVLIASGTSASYLWSSNAGSATTNTVSVSPTANTTYTVTGTANGCPVSKTITVVANICTGIQHLGQQEFALYPNPATDKLFVETQKSGSLKLISITGAVVLEKTVLSGSNEVGVSGLQPGAYEVQIQSADRILRGRIVISR